MIGKAFLSGETAKIGKKWRRWSGQSQDYTRVMRRFSPYLRKRSGSLTTAFLATLGYMLMSLLEPWPMKIILDNVLLDRPLPTFLRGPAAYLGDDPMPLLYVVVGAIIVIAIARGILYYYRELMTSLVGHRAVADIRYDLFSHIQRLPFAFHDRRKTGDLITRLTTDIRVLRTTLVSHTLTIVSEALLVIGIAVVMLLMDWRLTLIAFAVFPGLALTVRLYQKPMKKAIRRQRELEGHVATVMQESLGAIKVVQGYTGEQREIDRFGSQNKKSLRSGLKAARLEAKFNWAAQVVIAIGTALVLIAAVSRVLGGALSPGDLIVFTVYLRGLYRPLRRISRMAERTARGAASGERVLQMLETPSDIKDARTSVPAPPFRGGIQFEGVSFEHKKNKPVLTNIDLAIGPRAHVAIVGPTGAGKTTLASLIPRFYDPTRGTIRIDGWDIREFTIASLRSRISFVFQEPMLFAATIAENIAYGKSNAKMAEIVRAAELAGIGSIISGMQDGYDTVLGERGGTLSGGQRQCVSIARAIIKDAPIVIMDEPTTGLDSQSTTLVMDALHRLTEGRTVVMISHQMRNIQDMHRIVVLKDGGIAEEGSHNVLMARDGLYRTYHRLQVEGAVV